MGNFNGLQTPTKVEESMETYDNGPETKIDWNNSCAYVIEMMIYLASDKRT